jgi:ABC-type glycerol-3-phosphate transport system substrate-binding protein
MGCYRGRLPLEDFVRLHPDIPLKEVPWGRNPHGCSDKPLPTRHEDLPDVIHITAGRYSDDLIQLADRGLIEPLDEWFKILGLDPKDFFPNALDAVTYRGHIWALPHHAIFLVLRGDRRLVPATSTDSFGSWEGLLRSAQELAAGKENRVAFSVPLSAASFAEYITLASAGSGMGLADPAWVEGAPFRDAMAMIATYREKGILDNRQMNKPLSRESTAVLGLDFLDSVHPETTYAVYPVPTRLRAGDTEAAGSAPNGLMEAFAVKSGSSRTDSALTAFLQWLVSTDTEWRVFEKTNELKPNVEWLFDTVHVPLRDSVLKSIDFEYAARKFPDYPTVVAWCRRTVFPKRPPAIETAVWTRVDQAIDYRQPGADWEKQMALLKRQLLQAVRTTPVESAAYSRY